MAEPGYETTNDNIHATPQPPGAKTTGQRARQGQNIKGMVAVLGVSTLLVVIAFAVMLALSAKPDAVVNESANAAASSGATSAVPQTESSTTPRP